MDSNFKDIPPNLSKRYILGKESMEKTIGEEINLQKEKLSEIQAFEYVNVITKARMFRHSPFLLACTRNDETKRSIRCMSPGSPKWMCVFALKCRLSPFLVFCAFFCLFSALLLFSRLRGV